MKYLEENIFQDLTKNYGSRIKELLLPSGNLAVIREQTGEDDDILSNAGLAEKGESINYFVSAITIFHSMFNTSVNPEAIKEMPTRDKYFILIASRIFSIDGEINFEYTWPGENKPIEYVEDLENYIWDYSKPLPEKGDKDYFKYRIPPYKDNKKTIDLVVGDKELKYDLANGYSEIYIMNLGEDEMSKNQELIARNLRQKNNDGKYIPVKNFKFFSVRDMREIRKSITENDPDIQIVSEIVHPKDKSKVFLYPIMTDMNFFYPA